MITQGIETNFFFEVIIIMNLRRPSGLTMSTLNAGIVAGTTSTYSVTTATKGLINGKWVTPVSSGSNVASPTTDVNTGEVFETLSANEGTVFVLGQNAAGTVKVAQGSIVPTQIGITTTAGAFIDAPQFPTLPDDFMPLAYILVRAAPSASDWTFGSSSFTASGITTAWVDIAALPDRPQTS